MIILYLFFYILLCTAFAYNSIYWIFISVLSFHICFVFSILYQYLKYKYTNYWLFLWNQRTILKPCMYTESVKKYYNSSCIICLDSFESDEMIYELNCECHSLYHYQCIGTWLKQKNKCPLCKYKLY
jgi:hypothetical protein